MTRVENVAVGADESSELLRLPDGRRAQVWRGGAAAGPVVVFFHGCPDSRLAARSGEAAARDAGVQLVAVNRPGYGRSDPHESDHGTVADDTVAVADLLGIDRFAVLGMSVGGPYALACATRHPGRVSSVGVVAAPAVGPELNPPWHRDDLTAEQQAFFTRLASGTVTDAVELMRPDFEEYVAGMAPEDGDDAALAGRLIEKLHPQDAELVAALPSATVAEGVREALAGTTGYLRDAAVTFRRWEFRPDQVSRPTWLWYGELDPNASVRNGRWLAERIPEATLVVRARTAHLAALLGYWDEILMTLRPVV